MSYPRMMICLDGQDLDGLRNWSRQYIKCCLFSVCATTAGLLVILLARQRCSPYSGYICIGVRYERDHRRFEEPATATLASLSVNTPNGRESSASTSGLFPTKVDAGLWPHQPRAEAVVARFLQSWETPFADARIAARRAGEYAGMQN